MFDTEAILHKAEAAVTSSGYGTTVVDGEDTAKVVNLGAGLVRGNLVVDLNHIVARSNEKYTLHLMGGDDSDFTKQVSLCSKELGAAGALEGNLTSKLSRIVIPFQNEQAGTIYPYVRVRHVIAGDNPSINYTARLEKDLPVTGTTALNQTTTTTTTV